MTFPIIYFGNDWNAENRTSSHHIAARLAKRHPLLYVDSPGLRAPKASGRDVKKLVKKLVQAASLPRKVGEQTWHMVLPQFPFRRLPLASELNRELGTTLVLVTHDTDIAARCDQQLRIEAGRIRPSLSS